MSNKLYLKLTCTSQEALCRGLGVCTARLDVTSGGVDQVLES